MSDRFKPFAAVFLVLRRSDEILLQRRRDTGWMDGWYSLPSGHIEDGEPIRRALVREVKEEICIDVKEKDLHLLHTLHAIGPGDVKQYIHLFFAADAWVGDPVIGEPDKSDELRWVKLTQIPDNTIAYVRQALESIAHSEPYGEFGWE